MTQAAFQKKLETVRYISKWCLFIYLKVNHQKPCVILPIFFSHVTGVSWREPPNSRTTACWAGSSGNIGPCATGFWIGLSLRPVLEWMGQNMSNISCWNVGSGYIRWCLDIQIPDQDHGEYAMTRSWRNGLQRSHCKSWLRHCWLTQNPNHQWCHSSPTFLIELEILVSKSKMDWHSR